MRFEWDPAKAAVNRNKHGIDFETAQFIFEDPCCVSFVDGIVDGEERWHGIGMIEGIVVLVVVHTYGNYDGEEVIRIISARRATRHERKPYEQAVG